MKLLAPLLFAATAALLSGQTLATVGQSATIAVTADGTQPFTYKWTKDGAALTGATSAQLVLSPLKLTDSGAYAVTVLNSAGSATAAPQALTVNAVATPPPATDFSNQYFEGDLVGTYTPPVGQNPVFAIVPIKKQVDPGSHWDDASSTYTVGAGEGGTYAAAITFRTQDMPTPKDSLGFTCGTTNADTGTLWVMTPDYDPVVEAAAANWIRFGGFTEIPIVLKAGDKLHFNIFVQRAISLQGYRVRLERKR